MGKITDPLKTKITIRQQGSGYYWELKYADTGEGIHIFAAEENGWESNYNKALKAARHSKRLTDQMIERRR